MSPEVSDRVNESPRGRRIKATASALYRWFIRLTLLGMLILLATLVLFMWAPSANPGNAAPETGITLDMTAKNSLTVAERIAQKWSEDAKFVSISAAWGTGQFLQNGEGDWSLLFFSPSKSATALISVYEGRAILVNVRGVAQPVQFSQGDRWQIDSALAIDKLMANGGDEFLRAQPDATLSMSLDLAGDAIWRLRLIDQMSRRILSAQIDAGDGEIIEIQQSS